MIGSKYDYGLIAYGSASKTIPNRIDIVSRSIIQLILGSRQSTPVATLYVNVGLKPALPRKTWLATSHIVKLSSNPTNPMYATVFHKNSVWPIWSIPRLAKEAMVLRKKNLLLFSTHLRVGVDSTPKTTLEA